MMTIFQARIRYVPGSSAPDEYNSSLGHVPPNDFVVTRMANGQALSLYSDLTWDRTPYNVDGKPDVLNFQFWECGSELTPHRQLLVSQMHWIMFIQMWLRPGNSLSNTSLQGYLKNLRKIARFCEQERFDLYEIFARPERLGDELHISGRAVILHAMIQTIRKIGTNVAGFEVADRRSLSILLKAARNYQEDLKQTPPLPTRIYSLILAGLAKEVEERTHVIDRILRIAEESAEDPLFGLSRASQSELRSKQGQEFDGWRPEFPELLCQFKLVEFWEAKGYQKSKFGLLTALIDTQIVACYQLQAFTGMRLNEVATLPYSCLNEVERYGTIHYVVSGRVTKLTQGKVKRTQWVTSVSGRDAIFLAQRIAKFIYLGRGDAFSKNAKLPTDRHLFVNPAYFLKRKDSFNRPTAMQIANGRRFKELRKCLQPVIEKDDLKELTQIDPHRAWTSEKDFQIGSPWNFKSHQLRRSLALYAQRSGLVSLPTLKRQLQHITQEMSLYYARGSAFARDFIGLDNEHSHFGEEWQETQAVSQYLAYSKYVLFSEEASLLYGGHIQFINRHVRDAKGTVLHDRAATILQFKKGQIAWKPTPIGGCVSTEPCDKSPIDILEINCVANNCKNLVGNLRKTERVLIIKTAQIEVMRKIDPTSPEFLQEESDLRLLTQGYEKAKKQLNKGEGSV